MSVCVFIAADCPLPEVRPSRNYPLYINLDNNTVYDDGVDNIFSLLPFNDVSVYGSILSALQIFFKKSSH